MMPKQDQKKPAPPTCPHQEPTGCKECGQCLVCEGESEVEGICRTCEGKSITE